MRVELGQDGMIHIQAETALEAYALGKWCDDNFDDKSTNITVNTGIRPEHDGVPCAEDN